jgi:hypothetical protein
MYETILKILSCLDYQKYSDLYDKYNEKVDKIVRDYDTSKYSSKGNNISLKQVEGVFNDFLTDYANYIIPLSNKEIGKDKMLAAIACVKSELGSDNEEKIQGELEKISSGYDRRDNKLFPYVYDPNNPRLNYLESREESVGRSR